MNQNKKLILILEDPEFIGYRKIKMGQEDGSDLKHQI